MLQILYAIRKWPAWLATIIATLTVWSTARAAPRQCWQIVEPLPESGLAAEHSLEVLEKAIQKITVNISLSYGSHGPTNQILDGLMSRAVAESDILNNLEERVIYNMPAESDIDALASRLNDLNQELIRVIDEQDREPDNLSSDAGDTINIRNEIIVSKNAEKDIEKLQPLYLQKYRAFIDELATVSSPRNLSAKWKPESIELREYFKNGGYSVRLNRGIRVVFAFEATKVTIVGVSRDISHTSER